MMRQKKSQIFGFCVSRYVVQKTNNTIHNKNGLKAKKMAHRIKVLATKPDRLSSIPGAYIREREN